MQKFLRLFAACCCAVLLSVPLLVAAQVPVGGKVVGIFPCPHLAGYLYSVVGFGIGSGVFWFVPGTLVYPYGPPVIGAWILGMAVPGGACGPTTVFEGTGFDATSGSGFNNSALLSGHGLY